MNFLEKDLETIIWENYEACEARGLHINQGYYGLGKAFRQFNLGPYGIADLVYMDYSAHDSTWYVQIIELKRGKVDCAAYLQVKRYATAIANIISEADSRYGIEAKQVIKTVLIGNEVETSGDFVFALNADKGCKAFTYKYTFNGIEFEDAGRAWTIRGAIDSIQLRSLESELYVWRNKLEDFENARQVLLEQHTNYSEQLPEQESSEEENGSY